jgi:hypothetical protein
MTIINANARTLACVSKKSERRSWATACYPANTPSRLIMVLHRASIWHQNCHLSRTLCYTRSDFNLANDSLLLRCYDVRQSRRKGCSKGYHTFIRGEAYLALQLASCPFNFQCHTVPRYPFMIYSYFEIFSPNSPYLHLQRRKIYLTYRSLEVSPL